MTAYYNEIDPYAAQWLRNLIDANLIAPGDVDERSIEDVRPDDIAGYTQCHFFAGIGVWSHSLRLAGWPDDRPIWTGSCPCQPFSAAGKGNGFDDERHLWPSLHHLIRVLLPSIFLGEQVEGKDGLTWLDLVQVDMEDLDYACGAIVTPSAGVGAPHIRHRQRIAAIRLANAECFKWERRWPGEESYKQGEVERIERFRDAGRLADANSTVSEQSARQGSGPDGQESPGSCGQPNGCDQLYRHEEPGPVNGFWRDSDWLWCRDERWRPVRPGSFPLVNRASNRVGKLRAYGNAIDAQATKVFIESVMDYMAQINLS